ncbi:hypothetical protein ACS0TY_014098 [Phlomoides rotata]
MFYSFSPIHTLFQKIQPTQLSSAVCGNRDFYKFSFPDFYHCGITSQIKEHNQVVFEIYGIRVQNLSESGLLQITFRRIWGLFAALEEPN